MLVTWLSYYQTFLKTKTKLKSLQPTWSHREVTQQVTASRLGDAAVQCPAALITH